MTSEPPASAATAATFSMGAVGLVLHPAKPVDRSIETIIAAARGMPVRLLAREIDRHRVPVEVSIVPDAQFVAELDGLVTLGGDGTMLGGMRLVIDRPVPVLGVNHGNLGFLVEVAPDQLPSALKRLAEQRIVDLGLVGDGKLHRHPDGVAVVAPLPLVAPDELHHPVLPPGGITNRPGQRRHARKPNRFGVFPRRLVRDLVQDVRQVVHGVHHLAQVGLLNRLNPRVERKDLVVDDRADRDLVDVVAGAERVTLDVVRCRAQMQAPPRCLLLR
jgi:hypothetical protein